jgi:hypothetical protein
MNYEDGEIAEVSSPIVDDNNNSNNDNDAISLPKKHANDHFIHGK